MKVFILTLLLVSGLFSFKERVKSVNQIVYDYQFAWPGILPDNPLYKLKVLRNKIIYKMIYSPIRRVEFDLLMADKTLYASQLLFDKHEGELAKETALKGENYFSMLVPDYAKAKQMIPRALDVKIDRAYIAHRQLIRDLITHSSAADSTVYLQVEYFSTTNYQMIQDIRKR